MRHVQNSAVLPSLVNAGSSSRRPAPGRRCIEERNGDPWCRPRSLLLLAVWFGLLTGLTEATVWKLMLSTKALQLYEVCSNYAVAAPLISVLLFGTVGLAFFLLLTISPRCLSLPIAALFLGFFFFFVLVTHACRFVGIGLHPWAGLVFILGLAVSFARLVSNRPRRFYGFVRASSIGMSFVLLVLGALSWNTPQRDGGAAAPDPAEAPREKPNVILIVLDTVRAKGLGLGGHDTGSAPYLSRFARRGVYFEHAVAPAPWTLPSHAAMFTGRWPHQLNCGWCIPLDDAVPTLAEVLRDCGYATAGFVGNTLYAHRLSGLQRGFQVYREAPPISADALRGSTLGRVLHSRLTGFYDLPGRKSAAEVNAEFLGWLARRSEQNRPYFAFLNYFDAHAPYFTEADGDRGQAGRCAERKNLLSRWSGRQLATRVIPEQEIAVAQEAYERCIRQLDARLHSLLKRLKARGELANTLLIITSDHGEHFGEHGLIEHGASLYRPVLHVPLLVVFPDRVPAERRLKPVVSLRDLPATVLDVLGIQGHPLPGQSLARYWRNDSAADRQQYPDAPVLGELQQGINLPDWFPNNDGPVKALWMDGMQYIVRYDTGEEKLYDFFADPHERYNLAADPERREILRRFRTKLRAMFPQAPVGEREHAPAAANDDHRTERENLPELR